MPPPNLEKKWLLDIFILEAEFNLGLEEYIHKGEKILP